MRTIKRWCKLSSEIMNSPLLIIFEVTCGTHPSGTS